MNKPSRTCPLIFALRLIVCLLWLYVFWHAYSLCVYLSTCMFVCLVCLSTTCLPVSLSICLSVSLYVCCLFASCLLSVWLSVSLSVCLSVSLPVYTCLYDCLPVYLFVWYNKVLPRKRPPPPGLDTALNSGSVNRWGHLLEYFIIVQVLEKRLSSLSKVYCTGIVFPNLILLFFFGLSGSFPIYIYCILSSYCLTPPILIIISCVCIIATVNLKFYPFQRTFRYKFL